MEKRRETQAEVIARVMNDPERLARVAVQEAEREVHRARLRKELEPLVADLRLLGVNIETPFDLYQRRHNLLVAFPMLLEHLRKPYSRAALWYVVQAFETEAARPHWEAIVSLYESTTNEPGEERETWRDRLANAIATMATKHDFAVLERLIRNPTLGNGRLFLIRSVIKLGREKGWDVLRSLADDPGLYKEIAYRQKEKARRERAKNRRSQPQ